MQIRAAQPLTHVAWTFPRKRFVFPPIRSRFFDRSFLYLVCDIGDSVQTDVLLSVIWGTGWCGHRKKDVYLFFSLFPYVLQYLSFDRGHRKTSEQPMVTHVVSCVWIEGRNPKKEIGLWPCRIQSCTSAFVSCRKFELVIQLVHYDSGEQTAMTANLNIQG